MSLTDGTLEKGGTVQVWIVCDRTSPFIVLLIYCYILEKSTYDIMGLSSRWVAQWIELLLCRDKF